MKKIMALFLISISVFVFAGCSPYDDAIRKMNEQAKKVTPWSEEYARATIEPILTPTILHEMPKELQDKMAEIDGVRTIKQEYAKSGTWVFGKSTLVMNDAESKDAETEVDFYTELGKYSTLTDNESNRAIALCDAIIDYDKKQIDRILNH